MPPPAVLAAAQAAANRELTKRISRILWAGRILSVGLGIACIVVAFVLMMDMLPGVPSGGRRRGGRAGSAIVIAGLAGAFLIPFFATRALFRWLLASRRKVWIAELAAKHGVDAERLRRMGEAISEMP